MNAERYFKRIALENGFVRSHIPPHTKDIAHLKSCLNGPLTAEYWFLCKYFKREIEGELILSQIAGLQDTNKSSEHFGCSRWYYEEPVIRDTNGAFFVMKPIFCGFIICPENITEKEREIIIPAVKNASVWFEKECASFGMHYPNKITSDGALLSMAAKILEDKTLLSQAEKFWERWIAYTNEYGWGWGENTSMTYSSIIVEALDMALLVFGSGSKLFAGLLKLRNQLISYVKYHNGFEFSPSIRSYNFGGSAVNSHRFNVIVNSINENSKISDIFASVLHSCAPKCTESIPQENFINERIFGNSYASTFKGENITLGSVSRFPVMSGCYQNEGWGLGWQSMPVNAVAKKHGVSFLRLNAICAGVSHTHPATDKHSAYLKNALFDDANIPKVQLFSNQVGEDCVVVRQIEHIANRFSCLSEEWFVQNFEGELKEINGWFAFVYNDCAVAVKPLLNKTEIIRQGNNISIAQYIEQGEEKFKVIRYATTAWAIKVFDSIDGMENSLKSTDTYMKSIADLRVSHAIEPFEVCCDKARLIYNPAEIEYPFLRGGLLSE